MADSTPLPKILLAGGSGLLGSLLAHHLAQQNFQILILSRHPRPSTHPHIRSLPWNTQTLDPAWTRELESAHALINLTGRSVNCRYTKRNRTEILTSRILPTRLLGQAIAQCQNPPPTWLNASTATIYQHSFTPMDELTGQICPTPEAHDAFSLQVATQWEQTLADAPTPHTRKLPLRTAMVLAPGKNSVFPILRRLARLGLGGTIGPGTQFMSWIHHLDFCRAIHFLLTHPNLTGPINLAAPNPLPNQQFMHFLRHSCHRPCGLPAPTPFLRLACLLLRTEPELLLKSRHVLPTRLLTAGFTFHFPTLPQALANLNK